MTPNNGPTDLPEFLDRLLEGRQFDSIEDLQRLLNQYTKQTNARPLDEFHGISPEQMSQMLYSPFDSTELVYFPEEFDAKPEAPILTLFELLAQAIGEQGLKPTAKGNLPRNFCREAALSYWGEETYQMYTSYAQISRESDFPHMHITRIIAQLAGLVRKHRGRFILGRDCRDLLAKNGIGAIYPKLFRTYVERFNWAYRDGYPELPLIQDAWLFALYLLSRYGESERPNTFYVDAFLQAFPALMDELPQNELFSPTQTVRSCFTVRALMRFAGFLGLAATEPYPDDLPHHDCRVKALPLLNQAVRFQFST